jgi:hypothetical protein
MLQHMHKLLQQHEQQHKQLLLLQPQEHQLILPQVHQLLQLQDCGTLQQEKNQLLGLQQQQQQQHQLCSSRLHVSS